MTAIALSFNRLQHCNKLKDNVLKYTTDLFCDVPVKKMAFDQIMQERPAFPPMNQAGSLAS